MVNIIFDKVIGKHYQNKSLVLTVNKNIITWDLLFNFLEKKTCISKFKTKLYINNKFYTHKEKSTFNYKNFMKETDDFFIIKIKN